MKNEILFSIIIPVYNVEQYLCKCIDSILLQSFPDFELILVNDGSTDRSGEICERYRHKDVRVMVIHQSNRGVSYARNAGIKICRGRYIMFVDGDDWVAADTLTLVSESILKYNVDIVGFDYQIVPDGYPITEEVSEGLVDIIEMNKTQTCENFLQGTFFHCGANMKVYNKNVLKELYFLPLTHGEDYIFAWQALCKVERAVFIDAKKYYYRQRASSASHDYSEKRFSEIKSRKFVYKYTQRHYPELAGYAFEQYYKVILNIGKNFLNGNTRNKVYFYRIQRYVKGYFCRYFMGRHYSIKHKLFSVLLLFPYEIGYLVVPRLLRFLSRQGN